MKVENILKQITPEMKKREIDKINEVKLPEELQKWVEKYKEAGGERGEFVWKIFFKIKQEVNVIPVLENHKKSLQEIQFLIAMFVVLIDDVVDQKQDEVLLSELLKVPFMKSYIDFGRLDKEKLYLRFSIDICERITLLIKKFPRYKELREIFEYDINQTLNAMKYDFIINKNYYLINKTECWLFPPHSMRFIITPTVDLMCSSKFNINELSMLREIFWKVQKMARIGNWISTWEREIFDKDFSSGVFAYAISLKIISVEDLKNNNCDINKKIKESKIKNKLLEKWEKYYWEIFDFKKDISIFSIQDLLSFLKKLLILEIISEKNK